MLTQGRVYVKNPRLDPRTERNLTLLALLGFRTPVVRQKHRSYPVPGDACTLQLLVIILNVL